MKKIFKTLMIMLLSVVVVTGCKKNENKKTEKIMLERQLGITSFVDIAEEDLESKISKKDDFLLYVYSHSCGVCANFSKILQEFIKNTETVIYGIASSSISNFNLIKGYEETPTLIFYKSGEIYKLVDQDVSSDPFSSMEGLKKYIEKYAYIPDIKEVSKSQLDELIENEETFIVYIASSSCGDCNHFKKNVLTPYLKENQVDTKFYFLDVDKFLSRSENGQATDDWVNFKNQYGLSESGNPEYGYGSGYVPTIQKYHDGEIVDAMVYLNDVSFENNVITVTKGYYGSESGKVGKTYETYADYQNDLMPFYKNKFIEFMSSVSVITPKTMLERHKDMVSFIDITQLELESKIARKDDFVLYVYNSSCGACSVFTPKIKKFIENTESTIYRIEAVTLNNFNLIPGLMYTPSLAFYKDGEMTTLVDPDQDSKLFSSTESLTTNIKKYVYMPDIKEVSKNQLNELISEDDSFVLYIASSSCGDCAHFKKNVLTPYLKKNVVTEDFYFLDVDKFLSRSENGQATDDWVNFKNQYGLSESGNPEYGYGSGYVPTIQRYTNGEITDAMVYLNDIRFENDTLVVTEGYYGNESGKVGNTYEDYTEYQNDLMPFYKSKFIEFMEK